ncbi:MAG: hypothetical protein ACLFWL_04230 [Candidatus Brocadiia bacterium]
MTQLGSRLKMLADGGELSGKLKSKVLNDINLRRTLKVLARAPLIVSPSDKSLLDGFPRVEKFCPSCRMDVDGREIECKTTRVEMWRFILPLALGLCNIDANPGRRLVGIAGPPGGGKSVFCSLLKRVIDVLLGSDDAVAMMSLDGFHRSNEWLAEHGLQELKGRPETFDVRSFVNVLREVSKGDSIDVPAYDRELHEPVRSRVPVRPEHSIALVEGNFLLFGGEEWASVADYLDVSLFLDTPFEAIKSRIIQRHIRGGRDPEDARRHFERVDRPNYELCASTRERADLILERDSEMRYVNLYCPKEAP